MSGSDIKEACREAAMWPVREFIKQGKGKGGGGKAGEMGIKEGMRGLRTDDFFRQRGRPNEDLDGDDEDDSTDTGIAKEGVVEELTTEDEDGYSASIES